MNNLFKKKMLMHFKYKCTLIELWMCKTYLQIELDLRNNSKLVCGSVIVER